MKNQAILPITSANGNLVDTTTGEVFAIRYLPGYPRQIRFDASKGNFNLNGDVTLTKKGDEFSFIPLAYRIFTDNILGMGKKRWAEFFFLNEARQVCAVLFHGFSVENFMRLAADQMFYDDVTPCDVILTAKPVEKISKNPEANGNKYFIAEFSYKKLDPGERATLIHLTNDLKLWREETTTGDARIEFSLHWNPPHTVPEMEPDVDAVAA